MDETIHYGHTFPLCEETLVPDNSSGYPQGQDALGDFPSDLKLLGCSLTDPYHDIRHGTVGGDMNNPATAPIDPIFWNLHKFVDQVADNRTNARVIETGFDGSSGLSDANGSDTDPPRVFSQNPFRLYPYITSLPVITEEEKYLFGSTGMHAISAEFNEPVIGVKASDFTVNGSPATNISGAGSGPYVFIGFEYPGLGDVNVTLSSGNITDLAGNVFEGSTWNYSLIERTNDTDKDGIQNAIEVDVLRTNPTSNDTEGDGIEDGLEIINPCLDPLVNDKNEMTISFMSDHLDSAGLESQLDHDSDGIGNAEEVVEQKTDPCESDLLLNDTSEGIMNMDTEKSEMVSDDLFVLSMKRFGIDRQ